MENQEKNQKEYILDIADGPTRKRPNEHEHLRRICGKIHLNSEKLGIIEFMNM